MKNYNDNSLTSVYLMHKYWGKKPSLEIKGIIEKYSKEKDLILDPFSGYGGLGIEGVLLNRNVFLNDLNPIANFISECILEPNIDIEVVNQYFDILKNKYSFFSKRWYTFNDQEIITILRDRDDVPLKLKIKDKNTRKMIEYELTENEKKKFIEDEENITIDYWYPKESLIPNSRINVKENVKISDLFSKRALLCQSYLYKIICELPETKEKKLFKLAFTSNVANCSKLVPPISSRGELSQGAWMTGYYIGEKYLENNVFHYFENRVLKIIKGKKKYLKIYESKKEVGKYYLTNEDAKNLPIKSNTIDFVFTDFPYGDTVPYFEQSQLWNCWLDFKVDYSNEIVISNSSVRKKDSIEFSKDIEKAINEINRVLKYDSYFVFTYHSLCGNEWEEIATALLKNGFEFIECKLLSQKAFPPRQLNRKITLKGDLLVVYKKTKKKPSCLNLEDFEDIIKKEIKKNCQQDKLYDTNTLITLCVRCLLKYNHVSKNKDFIAIIKKYFEIDLEQEQYWRLK